MKGRHRRHKGGVRDSVKRRGTGRGEKWMEGGGEKKGGSSGKEEERKEEDYGEERKGKGGREEWN